MHRVLLMDFLYGTSIDTEFEGTKTAVEEFKSIQGSVLLSSEILDVPDCPLVD